MVQNYCFFLIYAKKNTKIFAYIAKKQYLCARFVKGSPKISIFGASGGTSRSLDLAERYRYYDLVGERVRKDGRVVYCVGLENRSTERYRGFESLSFRKILTRFVCPSSLEQANIGKGLHRMLAAACGDYEEIPLFPQEFENVYRPSLLEA